ncbi:MAG: hypothetical protein AAF346_05780 [Pseudomonadota bacterium]
MTSNALENSSIEGAASVTTLDAVAEKYSKLVEVRNGFIEDYNGAVRGGSSVWATPEPLEALVDPINDELYNLGWMMAETPAKTEEMVRKKAAVLADLVEDDSADLISCLTKSLLNDLRNR